MMMGGLAVIWLIILIVLAVRVVGPLLASRDWPSALPPVRQRKPDELARERYARGEIGWSEYQDVLLDLLKDRYVRGDLDLAEYEERTSRVLDDGVRNRGRLSPPPRAPIVDEPLMPLEGRRSSGA